MRYVAYLLIALTTALQGCSVLGPRPSDIPQRPIMEEQDTPFVFKQAYQTEGLYSTQFNTYGGRPVHPVMCIPRPDE